MSDLLGGSGVSPVQSVSPMPLTGAPVVITGEVEERADEDCDCCEEPALTVVGTGGDLYEVLDAIPPNLRVRVTVEVLP